eukprot:CAMPEP_0180415814 /NCGR_PEP_ID=MMETSP1036_2-20121128/130_1 /TAXON_ID=632150 /ORGANISM="Azadinium spinosum, Strain 3D9" /LENGTH=81 /DNA_ID=CAMNT_0022420661 /DNA_START=810 /DNA_END=1055 /DNA_ORIENTATION=-
MTEEQFAQRQSAIWDCSPSQGEHDTATTGPTSHEEPSQGAQVGLAPREVTEAGDQCRTLGMAIHMHLPCKLPAYNHPEQVD